MVDAVLPPLCLGCNEIVATPGALCAGCWSALSFIAPPQCRRCGVPFAHDVGPDAYCADCLARPPRYRCARAALVYDERSRRIVLPFKHGDRTDMAKSCAGWMVRAAGELLPEADLVVPVPLHWRRLFTRRYNQAALLAGMVAQQSGQRAVPDLLRRHRWTGSQAGKEAQRAARFRCPSPMDGRSAEPRRAAGRRCTDHRSHDRRLYASLAAGGSPPCRCPDAGAGRAAGVIVVARSFRWPRSKSTRRRGAATAPAPRPCSRRRAFQAHDRAADLHQRPAYRRLGRTCSPRGRRQARRAARPARLRSLR